MVKKYENPSLSNPGNLNQSIGRIKITMMVEIRIRTYYGNTANVQYIVDGVCKMMLTLINSMKMILPWM